MRIRTLLKYLTMAFTFFSGIKNISIEYLNCEGVNSIRANILIFDVKFDT